MVADAQVFCHPTLAVQYLCLPSPTAPKIEPDIFDVAPDPNDTPISIDLSRRDSSKGLIFIRNWTIIAALAWIKKNSGGGQGIILLLNFYSMFPYLANHMAILCLTRSLSSHQALSCSRVYRPLQFLILQPESMLQKSVPVATLILGLAVLTRMSTFGLMTYALTWDPTTWPESSSFYAVFDGHGGRDAAVYMKNNAMRFFFEDAELPQTADIDEKFLQDLETSHRKSFLLADQALADERCIVDSYCGTTALTALVLGRHLLIANAGDCRAVLCRKGDAVQLSQDHRPSCQVERQRVENLGGTVEYEYLNGELAVTRALGDWYMKLPFGSASPLTAEPEFQWTLLTEDDEFLIIGCDGIWDVISNQEAVSLVRRELRHHNDPQQCARELINQALMRDTCDNVTAIIVCFSSPESQDSDPSRRPRFRLCMSEEARSKLRSLLEGN
ncbi:UNVERIFIED_CONTAM: putative protein phosphatase 2C 13 [Sesamum calycinum]|uniref:protein-serine/threonine phosphatase n=1 Tax=Sesamum calycinum TaxID=2727403 RepID=A0AAW2J0V9_9LAMI